MPETEKSEIMTLSEVSQYLKLSEKTVLKMVNNNEIPCTKIANKWRFVKSMLDDWLLSRMKVIPQNDLSRLIESEYDMVPLSRLTDSHLIMTDIQPGSKSEILERFADHAAKENLVANKDTFLQKLLEREKLASTAIGNGVALPHIRRPSSSLILGPRIIVGLCREGADFNAIDKDKTYLFFLILSDSETVHLRVMSKLSNYLRDEQFVETLIRKKTPEDIYAEIINKESEKMLKEAEA